MLINLIDTNQKIDLDYLRLEYKKLKKSIKGNRIGVNLKTAEDVDPLDPMYDVDVKYDWVIDGYTKDLIESIGNFTRCRYLTIGPMFCMKIHTDFKYRYHIPIHTSKYCGYFDDNLNTYQMKEEGKLYRLNTLVPHSAFNIDREIWRTHLVLEES